MRHVKTYITLVILISFTFCHGNINPVNFNSCNTDKYIQFRYDTLKHIIISGKIDESFPVNFIFDTGGGNGVVLSEKMKTLINKDSCYTSIGKYKKYFEIYYWPDNHMFFKIYGSNAALISWEIFENKTIEISYKDKRIKEVNDVNNLIGKYKKIIIEKRGNKLFIPITVYVQNKIISENVLIDTGSNGAIDFGSTTLEKYSINTDNARKLMGQATQGDNRKFFITSDSIKISNYITTSNNVGFSIDKKNSKLLGNEILEHYDIIFDFKDFCFYLKPIE